MLKRLSSSQTIIENGVSSNLLDMSPIIKALIEAMGDAIEKKFIEGDGDKIKVYMHKILLEAYKKLERKKGLVTYTSCNSGGDIYRIGGKFKDEEKLKKAYEKLCKVVEQQIDKLPGVDWGNVYFRDAFQLFSLFKEQGGIRDREFPCFKEARLQAAPAIISHKGRYQKQKGITRLGRAIAAEETCCVKDFVTRFATAITEYIAQQAGSDLSLATNINVSDWENKIRHSPYLNKYTAFIEDNIFSRARVFTVVEFFKYISEKNKHKKALVQFAKNLDVIVSMTEDDDAVYKITPPFGDDVFWGIDFKRYLGKKGTFDVLPVWLIDKTDICEKRSEETLNVSRTVGFRFKINGPTADSCSIDGSAFEERIKKLREDFERFKQSEFQHTRVFDASKLGQIIFFNMLLSEDPKAMFQQVADSFNKAREAQDRRDERAAKIVDRLLDLLFEKTELMKQIANDVVKVMRLSNPLITDDSLSLKVRLYITSDVFSISSGEPIIAPGNQGNEWYKTIKIRRIKNGEPVPAVGGAILSFDLDINLFEMMLCVPKEDRRTLFVYRDSSVPLMYIVCVPFDERHNYKKALIFYYQPFSEATGNKIHFYKEGILGLMSSILVEVVSEAVLQKIEKENSEVNNLHALIIRRHRYEGQKEEDPFYVVGKSFEMAFSEHVPARSQGRDISDNRNKKQERFKKIAAVKAAFSSLPVAIEYDGDLQYTPEKMALVVLSSRPVNSTSQDTEHILSARTYLAKFGVDSKGNKIMTFDLAFMKGKGLFTPSYFEKTPDALIEIVERICSEHDTKHIIILTHGFGTRNIGRSANRHSTHTNTQIINILTQYFKGIYFYPMIWNEISVTRTTSMKKSESSHFEITDFSYAEEQQMWKTDIYNNRIIFPVYSIGTFRVVGEEEIRPQSNMVTYTAVIDNTIEDGGHNAHILSFLRGDKGEYALSNESRNIRNAIFSMLRGLHYYEGERNVKDYLFFPTVDPFWWLGLTNLNKAGEIVLVDNVFGREKTVILSVYSVLSMLKKLIY